MVLGLRSKNRKGTSVHVDFTIHVQEIKPWPPSQSLRSVRSVVLQWENGDQNSGSGRPVVPSLDDGRIVLDESFKLQATLLKEAAGKGNDGGAFQRNILELNLYEPRRDKGARGQLLGSAAVDLAEHGVIREAVSLGVPVSCKRSFRNTAQPVLFLKIQTLKKAEEGSSSSESLLKEEGSAGRDAGGSVSPLMHGECPEEEIASFTDDDISSSHSSLPYSAPPKDPDERSQNQDARASPSPSGTNSSRENSTMIQEELDASPPSTVSEPTEPETSKMENDEGEEEAPESTVDAKAEQRETEHHDNGDLTVEGTLNKVECSENAGNDCGRIENGGMIYNGAEESFLEREGEVIAPENSGIISNGEGESLPEKEGEETPPENGGQTVDGALNDSVEIRCLTEDSDGQSIVGQLSGTPQKSPEEDQGTCDLPQCGKNFAVADGGDPAGKPRSLKSVRSPSLTARNDNSAEDVKEIDVLGNAHHGSKKFRNGGSSFSSKRVNELESRVRMLEAELREAAAVEIGLYSVVAEHGSSAQKVHTPARRLLRLYTRACREESQERRGGAARSAVSGLVLVAKACGNDVPRLTFWLSNAAVLRATVSQGVDPSDPAMSNLRDRNPGPLRWESTAKSQKQLSFMEDLDDWEDPNIFISALEKIEAWIFSRVVESLWWQTLTPHMQSADEIDRSKGSSSARNGHGKQSSAKDQNQASFSMELWKRAFKDACERLCPVRAGGHQCGCLPMLPRLIMEQCVARLDVAMFNALLRESGDDIPTDPVSDPITDARVLPIAAGKSSFGAGAQLKNAIGNWSRGLTDWFGIDDDDEDDNSSEGEGEDDRRREAAAPTKSFRLLNALSDLLMLPKDMLLDESIRREVCPSFGEPVLRRILCGFEPDEFCPDPVPEELLDALDSQEVVADGDEVVGSFPCGAAPVVYSPPPAKAVAEAIGDPRGRPFLSRIGSAVLRKSHTSDDELEELDAPLTLIAADRSRLLTPSPNGGARLTRYHLLREVWRGDD